MTDKNLYIYNKESKELIKKSIKKEFIKNNKVFDLNNLSGKLNEIFKRLKINTKLFKTKITILLSRKLTPAEIFCYKSTFNEVQNIQYQIVYEEDILIDKKEVIIWDNILNVQEELINVNDTEKLITSLKNKKIILVGVSDKLEEIKEKLLKVPVNSLLEYENSEAILFIRA